MAYQLPTLQKVLDSIPKNPVELALLEARLKPNLGRFGSSEGFMADNETLQGILTKDYAKLQGLGLTYDQIADKLEELMRLRNPAVVGRFKVGGEIICGEQECPWQDSATCNQYVLWLVPNNGVKGFVPGEVFDTPGTIEVSGLMPHLIREHFFFEGNTRYRINPEDLISLFS